jgi:hypothetical protein
VGLISVTESPTEPDAAIAYFDGQKYVQKGRTTDFAGTIVAFTYPPIMDELRTFDMAYRVMHDDGSYEIHLVYGVVLAPAQMAYSADPETSNPFQWGFTTLPSRIMGARPNTYVIIDNGDGTFTAIGPPGSIVMVDTGEFELVGWPRAFVIDQYTYRVSSSGMDG